MPEPDLRRTEVLVDNNWVSREFRDLKLNDIFRMFESTGEPVIDDEGYTEFIALSDSVATSESEVYEIAVQPRR